MIDDRENTKFLRVVDDVGVLTSGQKILANLDSFHRDFGNNFNTLTVTNNADEEISISLDGKKVQYLRPTGGAIQFDWQDGIIYGIVEITNEGATSTSANEIRITVGRTGLR